MGNESILLLSEIIMSSSSVHKHLRGEAILSHTKMSTDHTRWIHVYLLYHYIVQFITNFNKIKCLLLNIQRNRFDSTIKIFF